jgi:branched-chain amino acid transport system substrate-binding protein
MKHKVILLPCLFIISLIAVNFLAPATIKASEPLIIGVLHSEAYPYANMMKNSFEMALEAINKEGGIKGQPLKLVYANDQGKPKAGEKAVTDLVAKTGAVMLVGAYQSSNTIHMARIADKLDRPLLVCTAADDRITQRKWENVYRLNPPAQGYTSGLEDFFLNKIKPKSMAIVYENSAYGTSGAMRMMWFCRGNNIDLRAIEPYHKERLSKDAALLVKNIRDAKIDSLLVGGAGGFTSQKFIDKAGDNTNHLLTATLWTPYLKYPGTKEYYDQYINKYTTPPDYHGAEAYSALLVAADVLKRADSYSPQSIRTALDNTDLITPFGPVKFRSYEKFERQNSLPTQVLQIKDGKFECVWPEAHAASNFIAPSYWRASD